MNIAIVGFGLQGESSLNYWAADPQNNITVCDTATDLILPEGVFSELGDEYLKDINKFDLIVRAPIVHPKQLIEVSTDKITSNTNEFLRVCPTQNIVGVTGTKGKGTTSSLIAEMLRASGKTVHLGGNIGTPPLDLLKNNIQPDDWVVLELANFQLIDIKCSPKIAVCLMVVPEHLDWHTDFDEYKAAKAQLFRWQKADDHAIFYADNDVSAEITSISPGTKIPYYKQPGAYVDENENVVIDGHVICRTADIKLRGQHNWQNVCAAVTAVWQVTQDTGAMKQVIQSFSGLEYRLELVRELNGVQYVNDSFGTTPETAIVAYQSFTAPKVGIVGGSDKGIPFDELAKVIVQSNTKALIAIGQTGPVIAQLVKQLRPDMPVVEGLSSMKEIVQAAHDMATEGDVVLLSTGCASFGMFENYKDRGDQFNSAVRSLA